MTKNDNKLKYVPIATKIHIEAYAQLQKIAQKTGLKVYNMLQYVIECYLRYYSEDEPITDNMQKVVDGFANFRTLKESFLFCQPMPMFYADSCLFFMKNKNKPQMQPILIKKANDEYLQTINKDEILKVFLLSFMPEVLTDLQDLKDRHNMLSLADAVLFAIKEQTDPKRYDITAEIKELFSDNANSFDSRNLDFTNTTLYKRVLYKGVFSDIKTETTEEAEAKTETTEKE